MMSDKKRLNRDAKGIVMIKLSAIGEDKKRELIDKYMLEDQSKLMSITQQRVLLGNWFNNAVKLFIRGASEEELNQVLEHVVVLTACAKYHLDIKQSYDDHDLLALTRKYISGEGDGEIHLKPTSEVRIDKMRKREEERLRAKLKILRMQDRGLTIEEIAEKMNKPESTIRALIKLELK